jgi:hypothetical protein
MVEAPSMRAEMQRSRMNGPDVVLAVKVVEKKQAHSEFKRKTAELGEM